MFKSCATCIHLHRKCDGDCDACGHTVGNENPSTANAVPLPLGKGGLETVLERIRPGSVECKCDRCYDEDSGRYKYYEENKEITRLLNDD